MIFSTVEFLGFLIVVALIYRAAAALGWRARKLVLFVASLCFYASWSPPLTLLLLYSIILDFWIAQRLVKTTTARTRKLLVSASALGNLGVLAFFKYGGFVYENLALAGLSPQT